MNICKDILQVDVALLTGIFITLSLISGTGCTTLYTLETIIIQ